ncbi:FIST N-terminal domain-containing protein [Arhodomonas sp. SL1]|uniref:FIST N-terminal domain-containing protein n=1 Tax=Arhodomonas sp. SL1 TaxID=3425691 RepID=UPI003F883FF9
MQQPLARTAVRAAIRQVDTTEPDPVRAAAEINRRLGAETRPLILLWCSGDYPLEAVAARVTEHRPGTEILGAVGSAVLGPGGYRRHGVSALAFPAGTATVSAALNGVRGIGFSEGFQCASWLKSEMHRLTGDPPSAEDTFALLVVDGRTLCEERLVASMAQGLGNLHLVGGSAGDHFRGRPGRIWHQGRGHGNAAVLTLIRPGKAFRAFSTHHFIPGPQRLLVTRADPARRVVLELNGRPAAEEYARAIGTSVERLTPTVLADSPPAVKIGDSHYVRSVRLVSTDPDEGLAFTCAVDQGIVFRVTCAGDLVGDLQARLESTAADLGGVEATLAFDCALRHLEMEAKGLTPAAVPLFRDFRVCGMASYGEQFERMHLNQTFTGIAFGHG